MIKSLMIAVSTYSKLPMPQFEWKEENLRYSMCFFPLIGAVIGLLAVLIDWLSQRFGVSNGFRAMLLTVLPLLITGGIHMDGYLDTIDARRSYQGKEARLEILKDPHVGAFAVIYGIVLIVVQFGCFCELSHRGVVCMGFGYVLSRCASALSVVSFPKAKKDGMLRSVSDASQTAKRRVKVCLVIELIVTAAVLVYLEGMPGVVTVLSGAAVFVYYRRMCVREFGGTTGDLAGYFLTMCETVMLVCIVVGGLFG